MKKEKKDWVEIQRQCVGLYMSGSCSGPGWGNAGYYHAVWEVIERNREQTTRKYEYRNRIESGPACREYSEGYEAMASLYRVFLERAKKAKEE